MLGVGVTPRSLPVLSAAELLDAYLASVFAAFSFRLLSSAYPGPCIRVRRSTDNALMDIGFVNGWLDVATLLAFVGAGAGYVVTWYDQSSNGRHITNSTASTQPWVVNAGTLVTTPNGRPAAMFGVSSVLSSASVTLPPGPLQIAFVASAMAGNRDLFRMALAATVGLFVNLRRADAIQDWQIGDAVACGNGFGSARAPRVVSLNASAADGTLHQNTVQLTSLEASWRRDGLSTARRVQMAADVAGVTGVMNIGGDTTNSLSGLCGEFIMLRRSDSAVLSVEADQRRVWGTP